MFAETRRARIAWSLACLAPALLLLALVAWIRVDAPLPDDVDAILAFANRFVAAETWPAKLGLLLEPHVDHRIATTRAIAALELGATGSLDLRTLALPGVLAWLSLGLLLPRLRARPAEAWLPAAAPVGWWLFQPQAYDALISPTMGANLLVPAFAAAALASLRRPGAGAFAAGALWAALAQASQGNGVLVLPAALASLLWAGRRRAALAWLGVGGVLALAYVGAGTSSRAAPLDLSLGDPWGALHYALAFLGSALGMGSVSASVAAGLALLAFLGVRALRGDPRRHPWLWGFLLFALLSIAANALGRSDLGADYAVAQPRYRAWSALVLALTHLIAFERWGAAGGRRYAAASLGVAVLFGLVSYARHAPDAHALASRSARALARFAVTGMWRAHPRPERAQGVLARSASLGTFRADPDALAPFLERAVTRSLPAPSRRVDAALLRDASGGGFRLLEGRLAAPGFDPERLRVFVVLDDGSRVVGARLLGGRGASLRFRALAPLSVLGTRDADAPIGLLVGDGDRQVYAPSIASRGAT